MDQTCDAACRMNPVTPGQAVALDHSLLRRFPESYRHLAYIQTLAGYTVKTDMPQLRGEKAHALYAAGHAWLRSEPQGWTRCSATLSQRVPSGALDHAPRSVLIGRYVCF